jgi:hypothetical protein
MEVGSMNKLIFTLCFGLILAGGSASAQVWTGHDFTKTCTQKSDEYATSVCSSLITGIAQAGVSNRIICMPENATVGETLAVGNNYIEDHPEKRHIAASELILASLMEAFPCPLK